ncbi:replicative DNA helicase [Kineosporia sp. NBRC 101731]|uniref:replicative DNA helicase n=1 Tax=Kineosporia sp. NBRC 101731 TaxID=3032199 RepID=UPI0024A20E78|nr:replicative DNA helicase [Kineosporia sp. NBRC 101731]GLY32020.1 replicative DNA helicase [Kineosporia sp. NBRC 101731]
MSIHEIPRQSDGWDFEARRPPQDVAAERSVLGGMLLSKDAIADVVEQIRGVDFYRPAHEAIFDAIVGLESRGEPADAVTVADELKKRGDLDRVGGPVYVHDLIAGVPTATNAGYYARIVAERAALRRLVDAGARISELGYGGSDGRGGGETKGIISEAVSTLQGATEGRSRDEYVRLSEILGPAVDEVEAASHRGASLTGVPTGFADLDALTHGLHPGQMIVIAARPAQGKSTFGLDLLRSASVKHGLTSVMFSLEMGRTEIAHRLISAESRVPLQNIRKGQMREQDWTRMADAVRRVNGAPFFVDDSPNLTLMDIRAKCRRLKQKHDLKFVVIDYLQLMTSGRRVESRQQEVSEFSRSIKLLAKELQVPIVALSQLNRGPEQRSDKKPAMSDIRESGSVEQDADVVILLHREDAYEKEHKRAGEADFIVAKHRNGPTDTITVAFQGHYSRFVDMAQPS